MSSRSARHGVWRGGGAQRAVLALLLFSEVWPDYQIVHGQKTQVGFQLEIWGVNAHGRPGGTGPGCPKCRETYENLRQIGEWAVADARRAWVEIAPFDAAWHELPRRGLRPEVVVGIGVSPLGSFDAREDDSVRKAITAIEKRLAGLGIGRGS